MKYNDISMVLGESKTREEVLQEIRSNKKVYPIFLDLKKEYQENFIQFCMGVRGVKMTYDTFFKHIFDAEKHPERLSEMLSAIIGRKLKVKRALPLEHMQISDKGSTLILDIAIEFESGELADVEIQKVGFLFPGQRASCYSSDMVMRQYEREKSLRGVEFTYKDLKKVYTIVMIEDSGEEFRKFPEHYIHCGKVKFDTDIEMEFLEEYYFIPLDIFFDFKHNKSENTIDDDLDAWLYFLGSDKPEDILNVVNSRPRFIELYRDICEFRQHPEVAIMMFSEALRRLDENTVQYMIDQQKRKLEEANAQLEEINSQLKEKDAQLGEKDAQLEEKNAQLGEKDAQLEEKNLQLGEKAAQLEEKDAQLEKKDVEIERLTQLLINAGLKDSI